MPDILVHKAVEPHKLSKAGKARMARLLADTEMAIIQPKYDGVYAQFIWVDGKGWQAFSRTGEPLPSVGGELLDRFHARADARRRYMGELWVPGESHQTINGRARKQSEQALDLMLFDSVIRTTEGPSAEPYLSRQASLFDSGRVKAVRNLPPAHYSLDKLYSLAKELKGKANAYDGLILRDPQGLFVPGRGTDGETIKIKPRASGDFRVVGTTPGVGNRAGGIGALVVDLGGVTCEVGTGLSAADVAGPDPTGWIAEVEYLGVTPGGKLREPSFKGFRFDKDKADVLADLTGDGRD